MKRPDAPAYRIAIAVAATGAVIVAALLFLPLTAGDDPVSRLAAARAAVSLTDEIPLLIAVGAGFGIAAGSVIGALRAYHQEVTDR